MIKKIYLLLPLLALLFSACEQPNNQGSFIEQTHAIIQVVNTSDYYAKVYLDNQEMCTLLPDITKQIRYAPDQFNVNLKITLHEINGDRYVIEPEKELNKSQKFYKGMTYKITITNNNISLQSANSY